MRDDMELTENEVAALERIEARRRAEKTILAGPELDFKIALFLKSEPLQFSTSWKAAMEAVEILRPRYGFRLFTIDPILKHDTTRFAAEFFDGDPLIVGGVGHVQNFTEFRGDAPTGPLAICRAIVHMHVEN